MSAENPGENQDTFDVSLRRFEEEGLLPPELSVVVPLKDEEHTLRDLTEGIIEACRDVVDGMEIVFVDDGSQDGSWAQIKVLAREHPGVIKAIKFRKNMGKSHALSAGFQEAQGHIVITMDGDLQDDPKEIPRFLDKYSQGVDLVVGWKRERQDPRSKLISSRIFNWLANKASGLDLHDHNCGFKCFRREVFEELRLYGDMHRMVPSLAAAQGFSIAEVVVEHHPRRHGVSKYGFGRGIRSLMDLWTVLFLKHFRDRPGHFIGPLACLILLGGVAALGFGLYRDLMTGQGKVLLTIGPMAIIVALTLFNTSLVAEMLVHEHFSKSWKMPVVDKINESRGRAGVSNGRRASAEEKQEASHS